MFEQECDCNIQINYNYGLSTANRYYICSTRDIFWVSFGFASVYFLLFPKAIVWKQLSDVYTQFLYIIFTNAPKKLY